MESRRVFFMAHLEKSGATKLGFVFFMVMFFYFFSMVCIIKGPSCGRRFLVHYFQASKKQIQELQKQLSFLSSTGRFGILRMKQNSGESERLERQEEVSIEVRNMLVTGRKVLGGSEDFCSDSGLGGGFQWFFSDFLHPECLVKWSQNFWLAHIFQVGAEKHTTKRLVIFTDCTMGCITIKPPFLENMFGTFAKHWRVANPRRWRVQKYFRIWFFSG